MKERKEPLICKINDFINEYLFEIIIGSALLIFIVINIYGNFFM